MSNQSTTTTTPINLIPLIFDVIAKSQNSGVTNEQLLDYLKKTNHTTCYIYGALTGFLTWFAIVLVTILVLQCLKNWRLRNNPTPPAPMLAARSSSRLLDKFRMSKKSPAISSQRFETASPELGETSQTSRDGGTDLFRARSISLGHQVGNTPVVAFSQDESSKLNAQINEKYHDQMHNEFLNKILGQSKLKMDNKRSAVGHNSPGKVALKCKKVN